MTQDDLFGPRNFKPTNDDDWRMLDASASQVFRPTAPIDDARLFAGRLEQVEDLLASYIKRAPMQSCMEDAASAKHPSPIRYAKRFSALCDL
jgi:hypothetical protein